MSLSSLLLSLLLVMAAAPLPDFDKLWDYGNPAKTESAFREILPAARDSGNSGYLIELLTQVARTHSLRKQFDQAHRLLDEAEGLLKPDLKRARVRYLLERGRAFNSARDVKKAKPLFLEAWELARTAGEDGLA